ncbi:hypothetical protein [Subsaximicrobium wynnwilliamsii]|uniref:hypothetical protein n=1 Tax=Subsaximicrobium wynnwilliamsii TaxID=291179 RepID=UPI0016737602|nr:hypothetical protein [Subsaximicrobium wynnwilliamsii]
MNNDTQTVVIISIYARDEGAELSRVSTDVDIYGQVSSIGEMETLQRINQL